MPLIYPSAGGEYGTDFKSTGLSLLSGIPRLTWTTFDGSQMDGFISVAASGGAPAVLLAGYGLVIGTGGTAGGYIARGTNPYYWDAIGAQAVYCATRFKLTTAVDAQALCISGQVANGSNVWAGIGYDGQRVASNFCFSTSTSGVPQAIDLGVPVDTNSHVGEFYRLPTSMGGLTYARLDGGPWLGGITGYQNAANGRLGFSAYNGTTAADRRIVAGYIGIMWSQVL